MLYELINQEFLESFWWEIYFKSKALSFLKYVVLVFVAVAELVVDTENSKSTRVLSVLEGCL